MIELILIRHAHAGPYTSPDEARHLSERGISEARNLAKILANYPLPNGIWYVSDAIRTLETYQILTDKPAEVSNDWYHASGPAYLEKIIQSAAFCVYLVAHNPSISYVASYLSGEDIQMDTANFVHLQWPTLDAWAEVTQGSASVKTRF
ncbi:MAG: SixA phosphatase family protein [Aquirufa sp.]